MKGIFTNAFVSSKSTKVGNLKTVCIDDFSDEKAIDFIHLLHCDIQGYEYEMLEGAKKMLDEGKIGCFFISTHSDVLHQKCTDFLIKYNFRIIASANLKETYSWDGVLVATAPTMKGIEQVSISHKN